MTDTWKMEEAEARFDELLDSSIKRGPQIVTRGSVEVAVLVSIKDWRSSGAHAPSNLREWLLAPGARTERLVPPRQSHRHRVPKI